MCEQQNQQSDAKSQIKNWTSYPLSLMFRKLSSKSTLIWRGIMNTDIQNERTFASGDGTESIVDKFAVVVKKDGTTTVGHLPKGKNRDIFKYYFLLSSIQKQQLSSWNFGFKSCKLRRWIEHKSSVHGTFPCSK